MAHVVPKREPCRKCNNPVFLAQRLIINQSLYHRTCFRCARCNTILSVGYFYETENDHEYCCEQCPDEEKKPGPKVDSNRLSIAQKIALFERESSSVLKKSLSDEEKSQSLSRQSPANSGAFSSFLATQIPSAKPESDDSDSDSDENDSISDKKLTISDHKLVPDNSVATKELTRGKDIEAIANVAQTHSESHEEGKQQKDIARVILGDKDELPEEFDDVDIDMEFDKLVEEAEKSISVDIPDTRRKVSVGKKPLVVEVKKVEEKEEIKVEAIKEEVKVKAESSVKIKGILKKTVWDESVTQSVEKIEKQEKVEEFVQPKAALEVPKATLKAPEATLEVPEAIPVQQETSTTIPTIDLTPTVHLTPKVDLTSSLDLTPASKDPVNQSPESFHENKTPEVSQDVIIEPESDVEKPEIEESSTEASKPSIVTETPAELIEVPVEALKTAENDSENPFDSESPVEAEKSVEAEKFAVESEKSTRLPEKSAPKSETPAFVSESPILAPETLEEPKIPAQGAEKLPEIPAEDDPANYPIDLNPFGDEPSESPEPKKRPSLNPFGSCSEDEDEKVNSSSRYSGTLPKPPRPPPPKAMTLKSSTTTNPFGDDDEDDEVQRTSLSYRTPVPTPRKPSSLL
jgi:LIM domain